MIDLGGFYVRLGAIALMLLLGFFLGKKKMISRKTNKELVNLLLFVFMPASLFMAFPNEYSNELLGLFFAGLIGGVIVMTAVAAVAKIIFNGKWYKGESQYQAQFALIFNNATFLGYPIVVTTFGDSGVVPYCGFIIAFNIALFSYGIWLFKRKIDAKLILGVATNPNIIAIMLGMVLFLTGWRLPGFVNDAIGFVGNITTPLSVICVGVMLSWASFRILIKKWKLIITAGSQLIIGPVVTWGLLSLLRFPTEVVQVCTLIQMLPTATSLGLFAMEYGGDVEEASELVTISTVLSMVTMPVMVMLLLAT